MSTLTGCSEEEIKAAKQLFAAELCRSLTEPYQAALRAFGSDPQLRGFCLEVSTTWTECPVVREEMRRIFASQGEHLEIPREMFAHEVYEWVRTAFMEPDDRIKGYKLYAELRGFIAKPTGTTINNNLVDNRQAVLVVPRSETPEDWQRGLIEHQQKLVSDA